MFQIHACAGKPEAEPTDDYVKAPKDVAIRNLRKYQEAGNDLQGRHLTVDRGYTCHELVTRCSIRYCSLEVCGGGAGVLLFVMGNKDPDPDPSQYYHIANRNSFVHTGKFEN